jgi:hypothetical protein
MSLPTYDEYTSTYEPDDNGWGDEPEVVEEPDLTAWMEKHLTRQEWKLLDEDIGWDDGEDYKRPGFMAFYFVDQFTEREWQNHVWHGKKAILKAALKAGRKRSFIRGRYVFVEKRK